MRKTIQFITAIIFILTLVACSEDKADPNKTTADVPSSLAAADKPVVTKVTIPQGTKLHVVLLDGLSTMKNRAGDQFTATLAVPVIIDDTTVLEKNTKVKGRVTDVNKSGRVKGRATIRLVLTDVIHDGKDVAISTRPFVAVAKSTRKRDAVIVGGGTGLGALIGGLAGGGKGAAIGAAIGAGGGTGTVLATKGKELHYAPETGMTFTLAKPVAM